MFIKQNNVIKPVTPFVKVDGSIKQIKGVWSMIDGSLKKIWEKASGETPGEPINKTTIELINTMSIQTGGTVDFHPNNKFIVIGSNTEPRLLVVDIETLQIVASRNNPATSYGAFWNRAGDKLVTRGNSTSATNALAVLTFDGDNFVNPTYQYYHLDVVVHGQFAPDDSVFAYYDSASWPNSPRIYLRDRDGNVISSVSLTDVTHLDFSPDNRYILVARSASPRLSIRDTQNNLAQVATNNLGGPSIIKFTPDGKYILQRQTNGTFRVFSWDGSTIELLAESPFSVSSSVATFTSDGFYCLQYSGNILRVYKRDGVQFELVYEYHLPDIRTTVGGISVSNDMNYIALAHTFSNAPQIAIFKWN